MAYIGITWDHPSGAALLDGETVVAAVSEERYSRKKNDGTFPKSSIDYIRKTLQGATIDCVGVASLQPSYAHLLLQYHTFSVRDMVAEQNRYWYPRVYENKTVDIVEALAEKCLHDQYPADYWAGYAKEKQHTFPDDSRKIIAKYMGIAEARVVRFDHHLCHALYAYYGSPYRNEKALVITIDGSGDGLNATVSIAENGTLKRIYESDKCIIGRIYSHVTLLLGMKRLEHEYKIMGLAPYGNREDAQGVFDILNSFIDVEGIEFVWKSKPKDSYFQIQKQLEGYRFDLIAAGMQRWVEELLAKWIANLVRETKIATLVLSGGVSMNVKAMGVLAQLPEVKRLHVPGSGADETTCIGAAIAASKFSNGGKLTKPVTVPNLYLGADTEQEDVDAVGKVAAGMPELVVTVAPTSADVAELLAKGCVIGRCIGRMEFGQRSLGNRAILADPAAPDLVAKINTMIKHRDFWMPFAPVVLDTYAERYLINPKGIQSPQMTIAFPTTEIGYESMRAACHPADKTARAQILQRADNPELYELLLEFERCTGRGSLLNTSFNLHGYPIVRTAQEAFEVFMNSGLEGLWLRGLLITKKQVVAH
jgi:carbamoyltransferase